MSKTKGEIIKGLKELTKQNKTVLPALVQSIDETERTAIVLHRDIEYTARLTAVVDSNENASFIIPKQNSWVLIDFVEGSETDALIVAILDVYWCPL